MPICMGVLALWEGMTLEDTKNLSIIEHGNFVLAAIYVMNLFGPPPPNVEVIGIAGNASWLFVLWAYWADRHRNVESEPPSVAPART